MPVPVPVPAQDPDKGLTILFRMIFPRRKRLVPYRIKTGLGTDFLGRKQWYKTVAKMGQTIRQLSC